MKILQVIVVLNALATGLHFTIIDTRAGGGEIGAFYSKVCKKHQSTDSEYIFENVFPFVES